jgi:hypothetical protein
MSRSCCQTLCWPYDPLDWQAHREALRLLLIWMVVLASLNSDSKDADSKTDVGPDGAHDMLPDLGLICQCGRWGRRPMMSSNLPIWQVGPRTVMSWDVLLWQAGA